MTLRDGMDLADLSMTELWLRYIALGGNSSMNEMARHVTGEDRPDDHEHNAIAQAINESFIERDEDHPVAYRHTDPSHEPGRSDTLD